jgi:hypothetical protein
MLFLFVTLFFSGWVGWQAVKRFQANHKNLALAGLTNSVAKLLIHLIYILTLFFIPDVFKFYSTNFKMFTDLGIGTNIQIIIWIVSIFMFIFAFGMGLAIDISLSLLGGDLAKNRFKKSGNLDRLDRL